MKKHIDNSKRLRLWLLAMLLLTSSLAQAQGDNNTTLVSLRYPTIPALNDKNFTVDLAVMRCSVDNDGVYTEDSTIGNTFSYQVTWNKIVLYYEVKDHFSDSILNYPKDQNYTSCVYPDNYLGLVSGSHAPAPIFTGEYHYSFSFPSSASPASYKVYVVETLNDNGVITRNKPILVDELEPLLVESSFKSSIFVGGDYLQYKDTNDSFFYNLETPEENGNVTGIGVIRGWACWNAPRIIHKVSYQINERKPVEIPYGSSRADTKDVCNDKINNGFASTINWNQLGDGTHSIRFFVNDELIEQRSFNVNGISDTYIRGLSGQYEIKDFPEEGKTATIEWSEKDQDFILIGVD